MMPTEQWRGERRRQAQAIREARWGDAYVPPPFRVNERVKLQVRLNLQETSVPQYSKGVIRSITEKQVEVSFGEYGVHFLDHDDAHQILTHEAAPSQEDGFKNAIRRNAQMEHRVMRHPFQSGMTALDEAGKPILIEVVGSQGHRVTARNLDGSICEKSVDLLTLIDLSEEGSTVRVISINPEMDRLRHYPVLSGEESTLVGSEGQVQFAFRNEGGGQVYRVMTPWGPRDLDSSEIQFIGESKKKTTGPSVNENYSALRHMQVGMPRVDGLRVKHLGLNESALTPVIGTPRVDGVRPQPLTEQAETRAAPSPSTSSPNKPTTSAAVTKSATRVSKQINESAALVDLMHVAKSHGYSGVKDRKGNPTRGMDVSFKDPSREIRDVAGLRKDAQGADPKDYGMPTVGWWPGGGTYSGASRDTNTVSHGDTKTDSHPLNPRQMVAANMDHPDGHELTLNADGSWHRLSWGRSHDNNRRGEGWGAHDLKQHLASLHGAKNESLNEDSHPLGIGHHQNMGIAGGAPRVDMSTLPKYSPGTDITHKGNHGTVVERFDDQILVAYDDGQMAHIKLAELAA